MGWIGMNREALQGLTPVEHITRQVLHWQDESHTLKSMRRGVDQNLYAAITDHRTQEVFAVVVAVTRNNFKPHSTDFFMYKTIEETQGPVETHCPPDVLSLLTPIIQDGSDSKRWAQNWREHCQQNHDHLQAVQKGVWVRFQVPYLVGGTEVHDFQYFQGDEFTTQKGSPVRLRRWRTAAFKVQADSPAATG